MAVDFQYSCAEEELLSDEKSFQGVKNRFRVPALPLDFHEAF